METLAVNAFADPKPLNLDVVVSQAAARCHQDAMVPLAQTSSGSEISPTDGVPIDVKQESIAQGVEQPLPTCLEHDKENPPKREAATPKKNRTDVTPRIKRRICELRLANMDLTQQEIATRLFDEAGVLIDRSTISKVLKNINRWMPNYHGEVAPTKFERRQQHTTSAFTLKREPEHQQSYAALTQQAAECHPLNLSMNTTAAASSLAESAGCVWPQLDQMNLVNRWLERVYAQQRVYSPASSYDGGSDMTSVTNIPVSAPHKLTSPALNGRSDDKSVHSDIANGQIQVDVLLPPLTETDARTPGSSATPRPSSETSQDSGKLSPDDPDDDDDEEDDEKEEGEPDRLKAFNMFVRLFVDENLDRCVPISKQPKDKIQAILDACDRQFPDMRERSRKRLRTYLKSCRRLKRSREQHGDVPSKSLGRQRAESMLTSPGAESILNKACDSEQNNAKKLRLGLEPVASVPSTPIAPPSPAAVSATATPKSVTSHSERHSDKKSRSKDSSAPAIVTSAATNGFSASSNPFENLFGLPVVSSASSQLAAMSQQFLDPNAAMLSSMSLFGGRGLGDPFASPFSTHRSPALPPYVPPPPPFAPAVSTSSPFPTSSSERSEVTAVKQLIQSYRESAAFLCRSATELETWLSTSTGTGSTVPSTASSSAVDKKS